MKYLKDYPSGVNLEHTHIQAFVHLDQNKNQQGWQDSYDEPLIEVQSWFWTQGHPALMLSELVWWQSVDQWEESLDKL